MSQRVSFYIQKKSYSLILGCVSLLFACESSNLNQVEQNYKVEVVSSVEGDIPIGTPVEVVLGFKEFSAKIQNLSFDFPSAQLAVTVGGAAAAPRQRVPVTLDGTALVKCNITGLKAGTHKITVNAENAGTSASCVVSLTISDRVYKVEVLNTPTLRIGEQKALEIKVTDTQDPQHLFYTTPGYKIAVRSLDDKPSIIVVGVDVLWDNFSGAAIDKTKPIQWVNNENIVLYKGFTIGEHKLEFTVTDPKGYASRSVHTLVIDSSRVALTAALVPANTIAVTETFEATYTVDLLGHPNNKLSCKWEKLDANDPYNYPPVLFMDSQMRPPMGEWQEYKRSNIVGVAAYPIAPNIAGSKQGFRMHVKDMWGWDTVFTYRFDVTSSDFTMSLEPMAGVYLQESLCSADLVLSNYPKHKNMTYKYKVVTDFGENNDAFPVSFWTLDPYNESWTTIDLSGADGKPYRIPIQFGFSESNGLHKGAFSVVMVDKFGTEHKATFRREFTPNTFSATTPIAQHNLVVGGTSDKSTATINLNYSLGQKGIQSFGRTTMRIYGADPSATITIDGKAAIFNEEKWIECVTDKQNPVIIYTPHKAGLEKLTINSHLWTGGISLTYVKINTVDNYGTFSATTDQSTYLIPYDDPRVTQDFTVTLASGKEPVGIYDWDDATQIGTSITMSHLVGDKGRLYVIDATGNEVALTPQTVVPLKYAVGKTLKLRYYPAAVNGGSLERLKLTITRKDGQTAETTCTLEAEDKGFTVEITNIYTSKRVGDVTLTSGFINVDSKSKYYKGEYRLKSYQYSKEGGHTGEAKLETMTGVIGVLRIQHTATVAGWALLSNAVVVDENGYTVTATNNVNHYLIEP